MEYYHGLQANHYKWTYWSLWKCWVYHVYPSSAAPRLWIGQCGEWWIEQECGGMNQLQYFSMGPFTWIHWEYSQQYGFISWSWYILWLCLKMGPVCPKWPVQIETNQRIYGCPIAYNTIKARMIWELCGTHDKHRSRLSSSLDLVPTTIPRVESKQQQQDVFVFVIVWYCLYIPRYLNHKLVNYMVLSESSVPLIPQDDHHVPCLT